MANAADQYDDLFRAAGEEWNVDPTLLKALVIHESGGRYDARGSSGEIGLAQLMPGTAAHLGVTNRYDPAQSIYGAAKYLHEAEGAEGDNPYAVLRYYNAGPGWRSVRSDPNYPSYVGGQYRKLTAAGGVQYAKADTGTATDATPAPAPAQKDDAVAKPSDKGGDDDAFTRALNAKEAPAADSGNGGGKSESEPDAFTRALGKPPETAPTPDDGEVTPAYSTGPDATTAVSNKIDAATAPALGRIGEAAASGWNAGTMQTPEVKAAQDQTLLGRYVINPLVEVGNLPFRALGALAAGSGQAAYEAGAAVDPRLGRDLYMLNQLVPELSRGTAIMTARPGAQIDTAVREAKPGTGGADLVGVNPLSPEAAERATARPVGATEPSDIPLPKVESEAATVPGQARPPEALPAPSENAAWINSARDRIAEVKREVDDAYGPRSVGAMGTPYSQSEISAARAKAHRRVAELDQITSPIVGEDNTQYVAGSRPTEAERMGDPNVSQREGLTRQRAPDAFDGPNGILTKNNEARIRAFDDTMISDVQADDLREAQKAAATRDAAAVMRQAGPVKAEGVADAVKEKLADPRIQENPEIHKVLQDLHDRLYDADGNLKTDIRAFWGMHDRLQNMLTKAKDPMQASSNERFAVTQINDFKQRVDAAMSDASGGAFRTFLDNQAGYLKQLNAYQLAQNFRFKQMIGRNGQINANAFHKFVTDMAIRRGKPGVDAAMDVPDDVMQRWINIDQDLKRAARIDLGKPRGSPTNLFFELAHGLGITGVHAATAALTGGNPMANVFMQGAMGAAQRRLGQYRLNRLVTRATAEPPGGYGQPPGNPLMPP